MKTKTKKKTVKKAPVTTAKAVQATLYAYVTKDTKDFITLVAKRQVGKVSQSTIVEKIFHALRAKPEVLKQLGL